MKPRSAPHLNVRHHAMHRWQDVLTAVVEYRRKHGTMGIYTPEPPEPFVWPTSLPYSSEISEFFMRCGGGEFGPMLRFIPAAKLESETNRWMELLKDNNERGDEPRFSSYGAFMDYVLLSGEHARWARELNRALGDA